MSIFKEYEESNKQFEKFKFEKSMLIKESERNISDNNLKFIPSGDSLALEIQNNTSKHIVYFDEKGVSELLKYLNKYLNPHLDENQEKIKPQSSEKISSNTSKQSKKS